MNKTLFFIFFTLFLSCCLAQDQTTPVDTTIPSTTPIIDSTTLPFTIPPTIPEVCQDENNCKCAKRFNACSFHGLCKQPNGICTCFKPFRGSMCRIDTLSQSFYTLDLTTTTEHNLLSWMKASVPTKGDFFPDGLDAVFSTMFLSGYNCCGMHEFTINALLRRFLILTFILDPEANNQVFFMTDPPTTGIKFKFRGFKEDPVPIPSDQSDQTYGEDWQLDWNRHTEMPVNSAHLFVYQDEQWIRADQTCTQAQCEGGPCRYISKDNPGEVVFYACTTGQFQLLSDPTYSSSSSLGVSMLLLSVIILLLFLFF